MAKTKIKSKASSWLKSVGRSGKEHFKELSSTKSEKGSPEFFKELPPSTPSTHPEKGTSNCIESRDESDNTDSRHNDNYNERTRRNHSPRSELKLEDENGDDSAWCLETSEKADKAFAAYLGDTQKEKDYKELTTATNKKKLAYLSEPQSLKSIFSDLNSVAKVDNLEHAALKMKSSKSIFSDLPSITKPDNLDSFLDDLLKNDPPIPNDCIRSDAKDAALKNPGDYVRTTSHGLKMMASHAATDQSPAIPIGSSETKSYNGVKRILSHGTTEQSPSIPVDPSHLKSNAILLLDPKQNGKQYHLDEKNRNLTDKDLLIVRKQRPEGIYNDDDDDNSLISSLTEVTYKQNKKEKLRLLMNQMHRPASNRQGNQACCGTFDFFGDEDQYAGPRTRDIDPARVNGVEHSLGADAALFLQSVMALTSKGDAPVDYGDFSEKICVCITRIYIATQTEVQQDASLKQKLNNEDGVEEEGVCGLIGLRCAYNDSTLSHDMGVRFVEGENGQAIVREVMPQSTAGRSGVEVGDLLSFAVPLNNTFQGYERACDFISRLEIIGMRTSFRELFDMFLSKTSSGWPLAIVFRRQSKGMIQFERISFGLPSLNLEVDFLRASTFLHELITQSREYDYYREADSCYEVIRGNIEYFLPRPRLRDEWPLSNVGNSLNDFVTSIGMGGSGKRNRTPFLPISYEASQEHEIIHPNFRRSALLTGYADNATGIIYSRCSGSFGGSGVAVFRSKEDRSWHAPCAINAKMSVGIQFGSTTIECITFLQSDEMVTEFQQKQMLTIDTQNQGRLDHVSFMKLNGSYFCSIGSKCTFQLRDNLNKLFYSPKINADVTAIELFEGKIPQPAESTGLFGALRRLEFPSTMYPHPTPPENLVKYTKNDWDVRESCPPSDPLEPPLEESGSLTLRELLCMIIRNPLIYGEENREFEIFTLKFKQMLFDGVSINRIVDVKKKSELMRLGTSSHADEKGLLKLYLLHGQPIWNATLQFITRTGTAPSGRSVTSGATSLNTNNATELNLGSIISISQSMASSVLPPGPKSPHSKDKKRRRFVSIEINDGSRIMFLARTGKDASLLSCGLKLLVERFLLQSSPGILHDA